MNSDQFQSLLRSLIKIAGSALAAHGVTVGTENWQLITGVVLAVGGVVWSHFANADSTSQTKPSVTTPVVAIFAATAFGAWLVGCGSPTKTGLTAEGVTVTTVDSAMKGWAIYVNSHPTVLDTEILTVSNAYQAYWNAQIVASNAFVIAATQTNDTLIQGVEQTAAASQTNLLNLIQTFTK